MTPSRRHACGILLLAPLMFVVYLLLSSGSAQAEPGAVPSAPTVRGSEVWSANMQVGNSGGLLGYRTFSERRIGELSSDVFSWRGTTYTVNNVLYNRARGDAETWNVVLDVSPPLPEGFECLTLRLGDRWLNLADGRGNNRQFFWYGVDLRWRTGATVAVSLREFPTGFEARSIAGWGNNADRPELGMAGTTLLRRAAVPFGFAMSASMQDELPNPRMISNVLSHQLEPMPNAAQVTDMIWQWGQFLDHDISLTPAASSEANAPISVPSGDPVFDPGRSGVRTIGFTRSVFASGTGTAPDNPREQVNTITAFIDASNVYGSDDRRAYVLRTNDGTGKLKSSDNGRLLPLNTDGLENDDGGRRQSGLFLAGDVRANEQVGLTALHTLFVREHNRLAERIGSQHPDLTGQEIFELARKIVGAQLQVITYYEFLPLLLGRGSVGPYDGYQATIDPTIATEFSTAAYRVGHTMLSPSLMHIDPSGERQQVSLASGFFNPSMVREQGIAGFLHGLAMQQAQEVDLRLVQEIRNLLFGPPGSPGRDLAALNIQRGRDYGLARYNIVRSAYGLPPATSFADVTPDPEVQAALERAYGEVRFLDLWIGGLAEEHLPGSMVGETFHTIIADQFQRLRDGDRYWFENDPYFLANPDLLDELRATTLAAIIRRNTAMDDEIPDSVFGRPRPAVSIEPITSLVAEGAPARFRLRRSGAASAELSVSIRVTESGATLRDPLLLVGRATFPAGEEATTFSIATDDDAVLELDSTVSVMIAPAVGYQPSAGTNSASVTVQDNDGARLLLEEGWNAIRWPGLDGISVREALQGAGRGADISDKIVAVYEWDETVLLWLKFFPDQENESQLSSLPSFSSGRSYWIVASEPISWNVARGALGVNASPSEQGG